MQRLPNLILYDIFRDYLAGPAIIPPPPNDKKAELMKSCRSLRNMIESSPFLWADVEFLPVAGVNPKHLERLSNDWLRRSQGVLVTIKFDMEFSKANNGTAATRTQQLVYGDAKFSVIKSIILPCAQRVTSLSSTLATDKMIREFFTILPGQFPLLTRVELILVNQFKRQRSFFYRWELPIFSVFRHLPFLCDVTLHILNWMHPYNLGLPWGQLTNINLGTTPMPPDIFLSIIQMTTLSLLSGRFQVRFTSQSTRNKSRTKSRRQKSSPLQPVVARVLASLQLVVINPSLDTRMFKALEAPALVVLRIELEDAKKGWRPDIFIPLLKRMPSLERLILAPFYSVLQRPDLLETPACAHKVVPRKRMEKFLSSLSTIRELSLGLDLQMDYLTLERLARGEILPSIKTLHLGSVSGLHVLSTVQRRNQLAPGLSSDNCVGTSSHTTLSDVLPLITPICHLHLFVPSDDVSEVEAEAPILRQSRDCVGTAFKIEGRNPRLFYYLK